MEYFAEELFNKLQKENPLTLIEEGQKRAIQAGHNFYGGNGKNQVLISLKEELEELIEAIEEKHSKEAIRNELGDVLFNLINVCRLTDISFDDVSEKIAHRWLSRKKLQEQKLKAEGYTWRTLPDEKSNQFWNEAKKELKTQEYL